MNTWFTNLGLYLVFSESSIWTHIDADDKFFPFVDVFLLLTWWFDDSFLISYIRKRQNETNSKKIHKLQRNSDLVGKVMVIREYQMFWSGNSIVMSTKIKWNPTIASTFESYTACEEIIWNDLLNACILQMIPKLL